MSEIVPRLLNTKDARLYLHGGDPAKIAAPVFLGRKLFWDKATLDAALDYMAGLVQGRGHANQKSADFYASWDYGGDADPARA